MVAAGSFPLLAAVPPDRTDNFIPGEGRGFAVSVLFNFRVPAWGNEGADGPALFRVGESLKALAFILGPIGTDGLHRRLDLIK